MPVWQAIINDEDEKTNHHLVCTRPDDDRYGAAFQHAAATAATTATGAEVLA